MTESETQHSAKKPNVRTPLNGVAPVLTPEGFIEKEWDCGCRVCAKLKVAAFVAVEMARKEQIEIAKETLLAYDLDLRNKIEEAKKQFYCKTCGFPKDMLREPVFLDDNVFSFILYEDEKCLECGHQKNGWTIKALKPYIFELVKNVRKQEIEKFDLERKLLLLEEKDAISETALAIFEEIEKQLFRSDWGLSEFQKFDIMDYQKIKAKWVER